MLHLTRLRSSAVPPVWLGIAHSVRSCRAVGSLPHRHIHMQLPSSCRQRCCRELNPVVLLCHVLIARLSIIISLHSALLSIFQVRQKPVACVGISSC